MSITEDCRFHQIFISYCWKNKQVVHKVADELQKLNYNVWIDRDQIPGVNLYTEIANGMRNSHIFMCFISNDYCVSKICMKEVSLAHESGKIILPVMLVRSATNGVELLVSDLLRFNAYRDNEKFDPWSQTHFKSLTETILQILSETCKKCSKLVSNPIQLTESHFKVLIFYSNLILYFIIIIIKIKDSSLVNVQNVISENIFEGKTIF